ncbi:MAG: sn-glycerol-1-phosphate dehydrogenase [Treponema sp.]|jgi:glycerol-1-phosphate dehydrogenase [NAD(P)+]|nr:sn-glycerol-1-phosphate dehydrogenase [Treponema sp.]
MDISAIPEGTDTKFFVIKPNCLDSVVELLPKINNMGLPILLVCDENTKKAAGETVEKVLKQAGVACYELLLTPGAHKVVSADYERVLEIKKRINTLKAFPVVVGSGTLNDLVKRAAFELNTPYLCVGTASSMDGYCSFGASLVYEGYKSTMSCPPPAAVVADTEILKAAPYDMTASGYGDLYAKLVSGIDWIIADRLGIEKIHQESWDLVQKELPCWVDSPEKLKEGDDKAFHALFKGLIMTGLAMQVYKDSRPASGAEHMISHVWEMQHLSRMDGVPYSHGFKVSVGTVAIVSLMMAFFKFSTSDLSSGACLKRRESWESRQKSIARFFPDPNIRKTVEKNCYDKWLDDRKFIQRMEKMGQILPEIQIFAKKQLVSQEKVIEDLKKAGCPTSYKDFGLTNKELRETVMKAQMIRSRYTSLDAIYETGFLPALLDLFE